MRASHVSLNIASIAILFLARHHHNITSTACLMMWPDGPPSTSLMDHMYQLVYLLVTYLLPMLGLSITYTYLGKVLWRMEWQRSGGNEEEGKARRRAKEKRRVRNRITNIYGCQVLFFL